MSRSGGLSHRHQCKIVHIQAAPEGGPSNFGNLPPPIFWDDMRMKANLTTDTHKHTWRMAQAVSNDLPYLDMAFELLSW